MSIQCQPGSTTVSRDGRIWVLTLHGEHDLSTAPELEQRLTKIAASGTSVVIELAEATFIDSQIINWLLRWTERAAVTPSLHLAISTGAAGTPALRVIDLLGLTPKLPCHPTKADAHHALSTESPA